MDSAELELDYNNTIRVTDIDVNVYEIMDHVNAILEEFTIEEDEDVEEENSIEE